MVTAERTTSVAGKQDTPASVQSQAAQQAHLLRLQMPPEWELTDERFLELCRLNEGWRIEADGDGGLLIMAPTGPLSSAQGSSILAQVWVWSDERKSGMAFDSSATFQLPNEDRRMADAAWISDERLAEIAGDDHVIWRTCPDFVVEVRSATDDLAPQQRKMEMWISQGARLGWLVDPLEETVWIYRPERDPERLERPESLTASEIADDLTIDFNRIWPLRDQESETS